MFLMYVNDIADNGLNISRLFADDTSVSSSSNDTQEIKHTLERDMAEILDWSIKWKGSFNRGHCITTPPTDKIWTPR